MATCINKNGIVENIDWSGDKLGWTDSNDCNWLMLNAEFPLKVCVKTLSADGIFLRPFYRRISEWSESFFDTRMFSFSWHKNSRICLNHRCQSDCFFWKYIIYDNVLNWGNLEKEKCSLKNKPLQNEAFSSSLRLFLKASSSMAFRIAFGETISCGEDDWILFEEFKSNSLQSRPGFAETRIGKSRSIVSSFLVVRSLTLKRKQIWSSLAFAPTFADLRQLLKHVN